MKKSEKRVNKQLQSGKHETFTAKLSSLDILASKRTGGANNIKGIGFQLLYSCYIILSKLKENETIRLEGIEDIDCYTHVNTTEYIQLKSTKNNISRSGLWNMHVLQNFLEVYKLDSAATFKVVHNSTFLPEIVTEINKLKAHDSVSYWHKKFNKDGIDLSSINFSNFLSSISFEKVNENHLREQCGKLLIEKFNLNAGTEHQYFNALFSNVFTWSKERAEISEQDIKKLMLEVQESFSKHPQNLAIQNGLITEVLFIENPNLELTDYFDGKAAKPVHIANNLPVRRKSWETEIEKSINDFDITLIRSSSGQGKSTLAWLVAKTLTTKGYSVFQINRCLEDDISHLADSIIAKIRVGYMPLIVIDGLNKTVDEWGRLAEKLINLPVKILITTREEDWQRHGYDLSKISLKAVDIKLAIQEAKEVFEQLKIRNKLHTSVNAWQPVWERVEQKGLLIEYVYLLTQGQMIADRLNEQIKHLNKEQSNGAKLEILRLISAADVLNVKVETRKITDHINSTVRFDGDRNEVYKQLEKEYFLKFDEKYVEGLHPVRSKHLVEILHGFVSIDETLITILKLIDDTYTYDFFISAPGLITQNSKESFYSNAAQIVGSTSFSNMVYAIDGLMHYEPYNYWKENQLIFDRVFESGGLKLFIADTLPFQKLNTIDNLLNSIGDKFPNLKFLSDNLKALTAYNVEKSDLVYFITLLQANIRIEEIKNYEGIGFLSKWFKRVNIDPPVIKQLDESQLLNSLGNNDNINHSGELFNYYNITNPQKFKSFIDANKEDIIAHLKIKTNTLTIEEKNECVYMNYLVDKEVEKVNDLSVYRINTLHDFLPFYNKYCTKAIFFPFPSESYYKEIIDMSIKEMPNENIQNVFDVHINQIWNGVISDQYGVDSVFDWQKQYYDVRLQAIEFVKNCVRFFEAHTAKDNSRIKSTAVLLTTNMNELSNLFKQLRDFPRNGQKYYDKRKYSEEQKEINSWQQSLSNFVSQFTGIITPKGSNDRNLATRNLQSAVYKLDEMQKAFDAILSSTFKYFTIENISEQEGLWYNRLYKTVLFYNDFAQKNSPAIIGVPKSIIEDWFNESIQQQHEFINETIIRAQEGTPYTFIFPKEIIEEEILKKMVLGVRCANWNDEAWDDFFNVMAELVDFDKTEIDSFIFIFIKGNEALGGIRVGRNYFERIRKATETGEMDESSFENPASIFPDDKYIKYLEGIKWRPASSTVGNDSFFALITDMWKLKEHRERLNQRNQIEKSWLELNQDDYKLSITKHLEEFKDLVSADEYNKYNTIVNDFLNQKAALSTEDMLLLVNNRLEEKNN